MGLAQLAQLILSLMFSRSIPPEENCVFFVSLSIFFFLEILRPVELAKKKCKIIHG